MKQQPQQWMAHTYTKLAKKNTREKLVSPHTTNTPQLISIYMQYYTNKQKYFLLTPTNNPPRLIELETTLRIKTAHNTRGYGLIG